MAHDLQPGFIIRNKYEVLSKLGAGGMGSVYRARHLTFRENCAIKVVGKELAQDDDFRRRFQREAYIARQLRHPNVVRVEDFDSTDDGCLYLVMELVEGPTLRQIMKKEGALPLVRAVPIARQLADALAAAHDLGIVHRDVKPDNLIVTTDETGQEVAKVLDFGIAKLHEAPGQTVMHLTMTGMIVGTPWYMSPEQYLGEKAGGPIDGRADIYSFGVLFYEMVTGKLPFQAETPNSLMMQHLQSMPLSPERARPDLNVPKAISAVILRALEKDRTRRFQTARELISALDGAGKSGAVERNEAPKFISVVSDESATEVLALTDTSRPGQTVRAWSPTRKRRFLYLIAATVLGVLLAGVGYFQLRPGQDKQIAEAVRTKLRSSSSETLRASRIQVSVDRGVVELSGTLTTGEDAALAASIAVSVPHVAHVNNRITVVPASSKPDSTEDAAKLFRTGQELMDLGDYPSAIDNFQKALSLDPSNSSASAWLARAQKAQVTEEALLRGRR